MAESLQINIEHEANSNEKAKSRTDHFSQKVTSLESIFFVTNFVLELPSAVFDQLSSVHKPQFALLSMLMSFFVLIISVIDLVYKGRQEKVSLMKKGFILWFYCPDFKPFGTFPDIIGLVFALFQWIFAAITYSFVSRNADNPIKLCTLPIIFAFGLLYSKLSRNLLQIRSVSNLTKFHREKDFTLAELAAATDNFSADNCWLGHGRFGAVYRGQLKDGRQVAVKRKDISEHNNAAEEKAFESELLYYLRLHHKHLVGLIGYCEEESERLFVFEYMPNGTLYNQLFQIENSTIDSWPIRIRIALDAARGIEYLHNYAVPPIIHRAIRSSCIVLDANWTARVADFGLAWMRLESEHNYKLGIEAVRDGYVDPVYSSEYVFTEKSDVYSFGVVLLELLTGKMAVFDNGGRPTNLVEFVESKITGNELAVILDRRIGPPEPVNDAEAVEMVAYTALHCVNSDGNNRPNITTIVNNLEQALSLLGEIREGSECNEMIKHVE